MGYMTDERRLIQETARAFAVKEVLPVANKLDPDWRDARLTKIFEGTSEMQQRIISDHLLGKPRSA